MEPNILQRGPAFLAKYKKILENKLAQLPDPQKVHLIQGGDAEGTVKKRQLEKDYENIKNALKFVEQGIYGSCQSCGCDIPDARLEVIPETLYCVICASICAPK